MSEDVKTETALERWKSIATILSLVAVPTVVALSGAWIQDSVKNSESRTKSMDLAIQILSFLALDDFSSPGEFQNTQGIHKSSV